jgi:hypothetical protein
MQIYMRKRRQNEAKGAFLYFRCKHTWTELLINRLSVQMLNVIIKTNIYTLQNTYMTIYNFFNIEMPLQIDFSHN